MNLVRGIGYCDVCSDTLNHTQSMRGFSYLRCVSSRQKECSNRSGYPYWKLESLLLAFDQIIYATAKLRGHDDASAHNLSLLKASIARKKDKLRRMVVAFADKGGPVRQAAMAQIDALGAEIERQEAELTRAHQDIHPGGLIEHDGFLVRFLAARARIDSSDPDARLSGRALLAAEFRRIIESVVLHPSRFITLHMKPEASGSRTVYALSPDGFLGIHHSGPEERNAFVGQFVLHRIDKQLTLPSVDPVHRSKERLLPSWNADEQLDRMQMIYTPEGNWQTVMID